MSSDAEKTVQRMDEALLDKCRRHGLFKSGDRVIAACSGGADSMALLLFLLRHRRTLEIEVLEATPSRSRPDRGSALVRNRTLNQNGEEVQVFTVRIVVPRRPTP